MAPSWMESSYRGRKKQSMKDSLRLAAHADMTNQLLKEQGFVPVKELWVKIHWPATAG